MLFKVGAFVALIVALVGGVVWLSRIQALAINTVQVSGNVGIESSDIQSIANAHLAGTYAAVFPKSNKLLYPKKAIEQDIRTHFPSISTLTIDTEKNSLDVSISERKPAYVWCKGSPTKSETDCYFMDDKGYIFSEAPNFSGDAYFAFYGLISDDNPIGKTFLGPDQFTALEQFRASLKQENIIITSYLAKAEDVSEVYLSTGGKIIFKASQNPETLAASLILLKKNTDLFKSENAKSLEYIDLRFGNKVFYKNYGDNAVQTPQ